MPTKIQHAGEDMGRYLRPGVIIALKAVQPRVASRKVISAYTSVGVESEISILSESIMVGVIYICSSYSGRSKCVVESDIDG